MSGLYYEYGRASGVLCDWTESEKSLLKALEIRRSNSIPHPGDLVELARMHLDQKHFLAATQYFSEAHPQLQRISIETRNPIGYAVFLDEYATALEQTQKDAEARPLRSQALELRNKFPGEKARNDRTPYGTQCNAP
jgi:hypothetical protein